MIKEAIDWFSVKITCGVWVLAAFTWNDALMWGAGLATLSTIIYNGIRIYKELKNKK